MDVWIVLAVVSLVLLPWPVAAWLGRHSLASPPVPPPDPEPPLTALEAKQIRALGVCVFCGKYHGGLCRRVAEIWYYPAGGIRHVVLKDDWDESRSIAPEDLPDEN